jgi:arylsulfatase A-like enzyme
MVTHTDEMIGDVVAALKAAGRWGHTLVVFSADNGGPGWSRGDPAARGAEGWPAPVRWDPHVIERNWPYRGQKHEVWEGLGRIDALHYCSSTSYQIRKHIRHLHF